MRRLLLISSLLVILAAGWGIQNTEYTRTVQKSTDASIPFSYSALQQAQSESRPVFVEITADWCITCQVNKKRVLDNEEIKQIFVDKNIAWLRADWTQKDELISKYMNQFHQYAVPTYIYYAPGKAPKVFTGLLQKSSLIDILFQ